MSLEGTLHDMSLTDLFQVFRMGAKSGVLLLVSGHEHGLIYVREGHLIDAVLVRGVEHHVVATGEEAVIDLLQWEDASFTFRYNIAVADRPARIIHDGEWLVLEGLRRGGGPPRALPHEQITLDTRFDLVPTPLSASADVGLDLDQWRILSQIVVSQSVREICGRTGISPARAIQALGELLAIGLVAVALPPSVPPRTRVESGRRPGVHPGVPELRAIPADVSVAANPGRGLVRAIMRRVRSL